MSKAKKCELRDYIVLNEFKNLNDRYLYVGVLVCVRILV